VTLSLSAYMRDLQTRQRKAFIPFLTAGYPDDRRFRSLLAGAAAHADVIEVGLPFSDPVADGPTICAASEKALAAGATTDRLFEAVEATASLPPSIIMTYLNPLLAYGTEAFLQRAARAGIQGLLLTDLPPEDGEDLLAKAADLGIASVLLVAPTTSDERLARIASLATGFLYCVAVRGITGARTTTTDDARLTVQRLRAHSDLPVVVGFGISTPEHVRTTCEFADGVVVGSALVQWISQHADAADLETGFRDQLARLSAAAHA